MPILFQVNSGTSSAVIDLHLKVADVNWFKSAVIQAVFLMCNEQNWEVQGGGDVETAANYGMKLLQSMTWGVPPMTRIIGEMVDYAGECNPIPTALADDGWLVCDGQLLQELDYPELFAVIGTLYNTGLEPSGAFRVPNFRRRSPMYLNSPSELGTKIGAETHTLEVTEIPAHSHVMPRASSSPNAGGSWVSGTGSTTSTHSTQQTGGGGAHNNIHPVLFVNRLIKAKNA